MDLPSNDEIGCNRVMTIFYRQIVAFSTQAGSALALILMASLTFPASGAEASPQRFMHRAGTDGLIAKVASTAGPAATQTFEAPWAFSCSAAQKKAERNCDVTETIILNDKAGSRAILKVTIGISPPDRKPAMMITLPHGIYLPAGVRLTIDGKEWLPASIQTCDNGGCYVGLPIDSDARARLEGGRALQITFQSLERKEVVLPVSLTGLGDTLAKIE
jgi:invasion protein IalB